jgi:hypothetical protein
MEKHITDYKIIDSIMTKLNELQTLIQTNTDSPSPSSSTTSSPVITKNKRLGFGKESHLLNPEPSNRDAKSIGMPINYI